MYLDDRILQQRYFVNFNQQGLESRRHLDFEMLRALVNRLNIIH